MSKGLEALEIVKAAMLSSGNCLLNSLWDYANAIEKELKALEIIKEKKVNVDFLRWECFPLDWFTHPEGLIEYNDSISMTQKELTQEEYDLLKEVLL